MLKRGQAALEYVVIAGIILAILIPLFYYAFNISSERIVESQAADTVESLSKAADEIYALSPGSKRFVWVSIPGGVQSSQINENEISLTISIAGRVSDITSRPRATIVGSIPTDQGNYRIPVELLDSGVVRIGDANDTTAPTITWKSPSNLACNPITLRANTNEPATCKFSLSEGKNQLSS